METKTGIIESVTKQETDEWERWTFVIDGKKFSTFDAEIGNNFKKGDDVKMTGEKKGKYWNMKTMEKNDKEKNPAIVKFKEETKKEFHLSPEECRARALEIGIKFVKQFGNKEEKTLIEIAEEMHKYITKTE